MYFDFNKPDDIPSELLGTFDMVVVDPPFITEEVWRKYGASSNLLLKTGVDENGRLLHYYFSCVLRLQSVA